MTDSTTTPSSTAQPRALPTELISPVELAKRLDCTRANVYLLARKAWFPQSYRYGPRMQRWDWPAVVAAMEANRARIAAPIQQHLREIGFGSPRAKVRRTAVNALRDGIA